MEWLFEYTNSLSVFALFGLLSGLFSAYAYIPYIVDTATGKTHPQRASWLIWSVLGSIAFFSQIHEGASASLWFAGVQVSGTIIVFLLSIRAGSGRYLKPSDHVVLLFALAGLILWYITDSAAYALFISIGISLLGGSVTIIKAFREPDSETMSTWVVSLVASMYALVSVGKMDLILMAYPIYLLVLYSLIVSAMLLGKLVQREVSIQLSQRMVDPQLSKSY